MEDKKQKDIYSVAGAKLSRRTMSVKELKDYLGEKGYSDHDIHTLIEEYISLGYLNDAKYSEAYFRYGERKGWSNSRIKRELIRRGVSEDDVEEGRFAWQQERMISYLGGDENGRADRDRALGVAKKIVTKGDLDYRGRIEEKTKARLARRLYSYGYSSSLIIEIISVLEEDLNDE